MIHQFFDFLIFLSLFFLVFQILKFSLYCLYLWQIVEYRLDRFLVRLTCKGDRKEFLRYFNFLNLYSANKYPKITLRIIVTVLTQFFFNYQVLFVIYRPLVKWMLLKDRFVAVLFLIIIFFYYLTPISVSLITVGFSLLLWPVKRLVIYLARKKREKFKDILVIGVTGSYGKSSTKEIIADILSLKYKVLKTPANTNTEIGVAKTILFSFKKSHQIFVVEMGAYKEGEIKAICDLVKPRIGVLTGVNAQHLALFGTLKETQKAKYELIESLPSDGLALFNAKNEYAFKLAKRRRKLHSLLYGKKSKEYEEAIEAGLMIGEYLKVPKTKMKKIIPKLRKKIKLRREKGLGGFLVFDDSYSSNPDGFSKALKTISQYKKKRLVVTPGIIELGSQSHRVHKKIGKKLAETADKIVVTNENFAWDFKSGAGTLFEEKFLVSNNDFSILSWLGKRVPNRNWVVLLEGRVPRNIVELFKGKK